MLLSVVKNTDFFVDFKSISFFENCTCTRSELKFLVIKCGGRSVSEWKVIWLAACLFQGKQV